MDETSRWVIGTLILMQTGAMAVLWRMLWAHVTKCNATQDDNTRVLATIGADVKHIKEELGDHDRGIRGWLHQQSQALTRHEMDIERLKK